MKYLIQAIAETEVDDAGKVAEGLAIVFAKLKGVTFTNVTALAVEDLLREILETDDDSEEIDDDLPT